MIPKNRLKPFLPIILIFVALNGFFISGRTILTRWQADQDVLIMGNMLLFIITLLSFMLAQRGLKSSNPHAFVRAIYGSMMIKFFVCLAAAFIYIFAYRKNLNKPALFICMGLYLVYTFIEVAALTKLLKQQKNG